MSEAIRMNYDKHANKAIQIRERERVQLIRNK
jgi:hypothetical protein